ncbi:hypothetical protein PT274_02655 [Leuconostocaceae bacterium ESL0958]|nr:hypothetical protein [Leuconostocaceae bacterium ESL0958]
MKKFVLLLMTTLLACSLIQSPADAIGRSHSTGAGRSTNRTSRARTSQRSQSEQKAQSGPIYDAPKQKQQNNQEQRRQQSTNQSYYSRPKRSSSFGNAIKQGIGFGVGTAIGRSIWHTMFGFGSDHYVNDDGSTGRQRPGYLGWLLVILLAFLVYRHYKKKRRYR